MLNTTPTIISQGFTYNAGNLLQLLQSWNMINCNVYTEDKYQIAGTLFLLINIVIYKIDTALVVLNEIGSGKSYYHVLNINEFPKQFRKIN